MNNLPIAALMARDLTRQQFEERPAPQHRPPVEDPEPRVTLRRTSARVLRSLADRLEPAPRCA
jgi:hypothetical protein